MKELYYWRSQGFKELAKVIEATSRDSDLAEFTEYCRLRQRGLRRQALGVLDGFISKANAWPLGKRRSFVALLMGFSVEYLGMMMPQPLWEGLVLPSLRQWAHEVPGDAESWRWLGILTGSNDCLEKALALDPADQIARQTLIKYILADVSQAIHELPWGYLGNPNDDLANLNRAQTLAPGLTDAMTAESLRQEIGDMLEVVLSYIDYKKSGSAETFQDWAPAHGRKSSP